MVSYRDETVKEVYERLKKKQEQEWSKNRGSGRMSSELDFIRESSSELSGSESDRPQQQQSPSKSSSDKAKKSTSGAGGASVDSQRNILVSTVRPSILSSEYKSTHTVSYQGFINLGILMLVVSHLGLIMENLQKYGVLINTYNNIVEFIGDPSSFPSLSLTVMLQAWVLLSYLVEKIASSLTMREYEKFKKEKERLVKRMQKKTSKSSSSSASPSASQQSDESSEKNMSSSDSEQRKVVKKSFADLWKKMINRVNMFSMICHIILISSLLVLPVIYIHHIKPNPIASMINCIFQTIIFLKLISYAVVNAKLRECMYDPRKRDEECPSIGPLRYPENINILNLYYFMCAPTLVYEENFPRNKRIRWGFLLKRTLELILLSVIMVAMVEQYIVPLIKNTMVPMANNDTLRVFERLLKITIPIIAVWVLGFYALFHVFLNITGELLCYGDRLFYQEWWNSTTMGYFWRTWNKPVNCVCFYLCFKILANHHPLLYVN